MPVSVANCSPDLDSTVGRMKSRGYRATPQRIAVLEALAAEPRLSLREVRERCPEVGTVTVYRTLGLLVEIGVARRVDFGRGALYELVGGGRRCRLICQPCGRVFNLEEDASALERVLASSMGLSAELGRIEVYARCRERCAACS